MATVLPIELIVSDSSIRGGQPVLAGTNIRVTDLIASHLYRGHSAEEIAVNYHLSLAQVYAALAYYYQNQGEVDNLIRGEAEKADTFVRILEDNGRLIRIE